MGDVINIFTGKWGNALANNGSISSTKYLSARLGQFALGELAYYAGSGKLRYDPESGKLVYDDRPTKYLAPDVLFMAFNVLPLPLFWEAR